MAIFHLSVRTLGRSAGRSAVAAAAYRAGARLRCERTGRTFDYTRRHGVVATRLVVPRSETTVDRQRLWDRAEAAETRVNSTVAREIEIALPSELDARTREALALRFATTLADRYGIAVDVAVHEPSQTGDQRNQHAHLLTTTRVWEPDGTFGRKVRMLDDLRTGPAEIVAMRALWAEMANAALAAAGVAATVDHRSHRERGLIDQPQSKLGPAAVGFERRTGKVSRRRADQEAERTAVERAKPVSPQGKDGAGAGQAGPDRRRAQRFVLGRLRSTFTAATAATMVGRPHPALARVPLAASPRPRQATAAAGRQPSAGLARSAPRSMPRAAVTPRITAPQAGKRKRHGYDEAEEAAAMVRRVERELAAEHEAQVAERAAAAQRVASIIDRERLRNAAGIVFGKPSALSGAAPRSHSGAVATGPMSRPTVDESFGRPTGDRHDVGSAPKVAAVPASRPTADHGPELRQLAVMAAQELARRHKLSRARLRRLADAADLDEEAFAAAVTAQDGTPFDPAAVAGSPVLAPLWGAWIDEDRAKQRNQQGGTADGTAGPVAEPAPPAHTPAEAGSDRAGPADSPETGDAVPATPARPYGRRDVVIDFAITVIARGGWSKDVGDTLAGLLGTRRGWVWREAHRVCRARFGTERPDQISKARLDAIGRAALAGTRADLRVRRTLQAIAGGQIGRGLG